MSSIDLFRDGSKASMCRYTDFGRLADIFSRKEMRIVRPEK